jgi:phospholipid N-methyltransferase
MINLDFIKTALEDYKVGALTQSSRYAIQRIIENLPVHPKCIIEYGPGDGITTEKLLEHLHPEGTLIAVESNKSFTEKLEQISDKRLIIVHDDATHISAKIREFAPHGADAVVSGIPFSFIEKADRETIVKNTERGLRPGGVFIVYQYSTLLAPLLKHYFKKVGISFEPRNIPPYFIMKAVK